ncbi:hypothetical protein V6N12_044256 [Hibiscus sabdariffa]|uniref:Uncharacterized protein n=1 Tax=Hibiscus sabdariffa TaxID=183260 RepID=A0ABR2DID4_9ROSI
MSTRFGFCWSEIHLGKRPFLLSISTQLHLPTEKLFCYLASWSEYAGFSDFLKYIWNAKANFDSNMASFITQDLKHELDIVLHQGESLWFQHSRSQWLSKGDRNTSFYHRATMVCKKQKFFSRLKVDNGTWCDDQPVLHLSATDFYKNLFTSSVSHLATWDVPLSFHHFSVSKDEDHIGCLSVLAECQRLLAAMQFQQEVVHPLSCSSLIWHSPHFGCVKANVDGVVIPVDLTVACGGVPCVASD